MVLESEGLPWHKQERGSQDVDIIAGKDFLDILMGNNRQHRSHRLQKKARVSTKYPEFTTKFSDSDITTRPTKIPTSTITTMLKTEEKPTNNPRKSTSTFRTRTKNSPATTTSSTTTTIRSTTFPASSTIIFIDDSATNAVKIDDNKNVVLTNSRPLDSAKNIATSVVRQTRSTPYFTSQSATVQTEQPTMSFISKLIPIEEKSENYLNDNESENEKHSETMVVAVSMSSSSSREKSTTTSTTTTTVATTESTKASREKEVKPLVLKANKSDFGVEEPEPITSNSGSSSAYPANVEPLTNQNSQDYHNIMNSYDDGMYREDLQRGRSVSYSAVIQNLPTGDNRQVYNEYNDHQITNNSSTEKIAAMQESKDFYVTAKYNPPDYNESGDKKEESWKKELQKNYEPTEKNWGTPEKNYEEKQYQYGYSNGNVNNNGNGMPYGTGAKKPSTYDGAMPYETSTKYTSNNFNYQNNPNNAQNGGYLPPQSYNAEAKYQSAPTSTQYNPHPRLPLIQYAQQPEQNYEVDESVSVMSNGRVHGVQPSQSQSPAQKSSKKDDNQKVGYVVEGRNYRKYRVEERTSDGFIVGEYGVVSHDDGSLRGVRYTADGTINPRLIYDALMKFLAL